MPNNQIDLSSIFSFMLIFVVITMGVTMVDKALGPKPELRKLPELTESEILKIHRRTGYVP